MRNLRGRLTLGVTLVLAIVLAVAGLTASRYVEDGEREALDDRLKRTAGQGRKTKPTPRTVCSSFGSPSLRRR